MEKLRMLKNGVRFKDIDHPNEPLIMSELEYKRCYKGNRYQTDNSNNQIPDVIYGYPLGSGNQVDITKRFVISMDRVKII